MAPPQHIYIVQGQLFDLFHLSYNNTSNLLLCHPDQYPIHAPLFIMHTLLYNNTRNNKLNNHHLYNSISNHHNNYHHINQINQKIFKPLKMYSSLIRLREIG